MPVFQHGPLFILIPEIAKPGSKIGNVYATDADEGLNSKIQYYITSGSNGDIKIDRVSGELFVVGNLVPNSNYLLNISAVDGGGLASRVNVNISIVGKFSFLISFYFYSLVLNLSFLNIVDRSSSSIDHVNNYYNKKTGFIPKK